MRLAILVIEDEPAIGAALVARLAAWDYDAVHEASGQAGLAAAVTRRPDAILLDARLPDLDGFEVCRRLKRDDGLATVPVIFLTANVQDEARRQAFDAGATAFVSKPYEPRELLETIRSAITSAGASAAETPRAVPPRAGQGG